MCSDSSKNRIRKLCEIQDIWRLTNNKVRNKHIDINKHGVKHEAPLLKRLQLKRLAIKLQQTSEKIVNEFAQKNTLSPPPQRPPPSPREARPTPKATRL
jgi:hypothetical protein